MLIYVLFSWHSYKESEEMGIKNLTTGFHECRFGGILFKAELRVRFFAEYGVAK